MADIILDFLSEITNVHFGEPWVVVQSYQGAPHDPVPTSLISFPHIAGGTPGWDQTQASFLQTWPHNFTKAEINAPPIPLGAGGGVRISRIGVKSIIPAAKAPEMNQLSYSNSVIDTFGYSNDTFVFFRAPNPKFVLRHTFSQSHLTGVAFCTVFIVPETKVVAGVKPPLNFPCPAAYPSPVQKTVQYDDSPSSGSADFTVDLNAGTVVLSGLTGRAKG